jgi:formylglycine-generating enzyme required for sulfatase activity
VFIAEALELCLAKRHAVPDALAEPFRRLALDAIDDEVELQARQAWGCAGGLGDPRIVSLRDPEAYVEVPAGTYPYGDGGKTVEIATPFRLGRYPVTNGQYAEFIDTGGYRDRQRWSDAGWAWLQERKVTEPLYWHDRRWNAPSQPVVGVSFWEAEACAAPGPADGCRASRNGKPLPAARRASDIPGAKTGRMASATPPRRGSA